MADKDVLNSIRDVRPTKIWKIDETGIQNVQKLLPVVVTREQNRLHG
jgi:hypothetical protein